MQQKTDAMTDDMVAELWAEFAADHYEIVDQLPLELHRNSRLLRELDQESLGGGCVGLADGSSIGEPGAQG